MCVCGREGEHDVTKMMTFLIVLCNDINMICCMLRVSSCGMYVCICLILNHLLFLPVVPSQSTEDEHKVNGTHVFMV